MDDDEAWRQGMMIKDDDNISWQRRMTMNDNEGWQQGIMTRKGEGRKQLWQWILTRDNNNEWPLCDSKKGYKYQGEVKYR